MAALYNRRTSPLLGGSPIAPSFAGLSLFHDNSRSHLLDDLTVLCGDIKFPLLNKAKEKIVTKCASIEQSKSVKRHESSTFATLRDVFSCRTRSTDSSFFDAEEELQQSSIRSGKTCDWFGRPAMQSPLNEKKGLAYWDDSLTSTSSGASTESEKFSSLSHSTPAQTPDFHRLTRRPPISRRRAMFPLWINTAIARIYPNNAESRYARVGRASFPSLPETLSLDFPTSPESFVGVQVDTDGLNGVRASDGSVEKKPRNKWNGNWV